MSRPAILFLTRNKSSRCINLGRRSATSFSQTSSSQPALIARQKRNRAKMSDHVTVEKIQTVDQLYDDKTLSYAESDDNSSHFEPSQKLNDKVCLIQADITSLEVDAIVNAANRSLLGGGGVDGRIHSVCGRLLLEECATLDGCNTGDAKITKSYGDIIGCKHIIHTVGPVHSSYSKATATKLLKSCYTRSLQVAVDNAVKSVAFSCISTGVYGYPSVAAGKVACQAVREFLTGEDSDKLDKVVFCTYLDKDQRVYEQVIPEYFPPVLPEIKTESETETTEAPAIVAEDHLSSSVIVLSSNHTEEESHDSDDEGLLPSTNLVKSDILQTPPSEKEFNMEREGEDWTEISAKDAELGATVRIGSKSGSEVTES